ncbi:MAG: DUF1501 domain-containing protein [Lentisphaeraceae bacterium]|nr:DUF1501 domain-containing protein [Lentisphaeraceae bacterium]
MNINRRTFMKFGAGSLGVMGLANSVPAGPGNFQHFPAKAKRVIFLFMHGGPSAIDTFDYKPALEKFDGKTAPKIPDITFAGANGRSNSELWKSPWKFKSYGKCGHKVSELFSETATHVDDICFLHSCYGTAPDHGAAVVKMNTGSSTFMRPSLGSWILYGMGSENKNLPGYITITPSAQHGGIRNYGSAFLPAVYQGTPLGFEGEKMASVKLENLVTGKEKQQLKQLELLKKLNAGNGYQSHLENYDLAFRMQKTAPDVFSYMKEPEHIKNLYGLDKKETREFGSQCLLARRMIESGVRVVNVTSGLIWDQHTNLVSKHKQNAQSVDKPIAGLLEDLKQRGLLDETLVIWGGEFGRTPTKEGNSGRDHNPHGYTMWMAGGGTKGGHAIGATDELGYFAEEKKIHLHDFHATVLRLLGMDHKRLTYRYAGRDFRLTDVSGHVVEEVFG